MEAITYDTEGYPTGDPMYRSAKLAVVLYLWLCLGGCLVKGNVFLRIPEPDRAILSRVAAEYKLNADQRKLLFAIRVQENGGPGVEMGVLHPRAQRFKGRYAQSLERHARWVAGTIAKRYHGDLEAFANRWCPPQAHKLNRHWLPNVRQLLKSK